MPARGNASITACFFRDPDSSDLSLDVERARIRGRAFFSLVVAVWGDPAGWAGSSLAGRWRDSTGDLKLTRSPEPGQRPDPAGDSGLFSGGGCRAGLPGRGGSEGIQVGPAIGTAMGRLRPARGPTPSQPDLVFRVNLRSPVRATPSCRCCPAHPTGPPAATEREEAYPPYPGPSDTSAAARAVRLPGPSRPSPRPEPSVSSARAVRPSHATSGKTRHSHQESKTQ
jgi:hypothetical protein